MMSMFNYRMLCVVAVDVIWIALANYLAFWLRFDGAGPDWAMAVCLRMLPLLVAIRLLTFIPFRVYQSLWRYTSIWDLWNIIGGTAASTVMFIAVTRWGFGLTQYPRSVYIIDSILLIVFLGGTRLSRRLQREWKRLSREKRILIYGAGDAGEMIARDIKHNPFYECEPLGFVDDDPSKVGRRIHGLRVLGTRADLPAIVEKRKPDEILVAMPTAKPAAIRQIVTALEPFSVSIKTLPNLRDMVNGKVSISQIRNLSVEDLLARDPVVIDTLRARQLIAGKRVLITGAGGSIGSELCRQVTSLQPSMVVLYERYENNLYSISNELLDQERTVPIHAVIGDVTDKARVETVLQMYRPHIVFHAAAHKHVPLMEFNPSEAVKNNVTGTRIVASAADRNEVERFVMVSTDKAVNPTSVMGATKRIAELVVQDMARKSRTQFVTVRFGNVLGSNGSVVPRFLDQIKAGGPVTVTHPEVRRYFMLIPEAVQLVLQAASLSEGCAIYVLEMGEQIKLVDLARNLIRLSGFVPDDEITIQFIGMRPGEKLSEELVGPDETIEPSPVNKIYRVCPKGLTAAYQMAPWLRELEQTAQQCDGQTVLDRFCEFIPGFQGGRADAVAAMEHGWNGSLVKESKSAG